MQQLTSKILLTFFILATTPIFAQSKTVSPIEYQWSNDNKDAQQQISANRYYTSSELFTYFYNEENIISGINEEIKKADKDTYKYLDKTVDELSKSSPAYLSKLSPARRIILTQAAKKLLSDKDVSKDQVAKLTLKILENLDTAFQDAKGIKSLNDQEFPFSWIGKVANFFFNRLDTESPNILENLMDLLGTIGNIYGSEVLTSVGINKLKDIASYDITSTYFVDAFAALVKTPSAETSIALAQILEQSPHYTTNKEFRDIGEIFKERTFIKSQEAIVLTLIARQDNAIIKKLYYAGIGDKATQNLMAKYLDDPLPHPYCEISRNVLDAGCVAGNLLFLLMMPLSAEETVPMTVEKGFSTYKSFTPGIGNYNTMLDGTSALKVAPSYEFISSPQLIRISAANKLNVLGLLNEHKKVIIEIEKANEAPLTYIINVEDSKEGQKKLELMIQYFKLQGVVKVNGSTADVLLAQLKSGAQSNPYNISNSSADDVTTTIESEKINDTEDLNLKTEDLLGAQGHHFYTAVLAQGENELEPALVIGNVITCHAALGFSFSKAANEAVSKYVYSGEFEVENGEVLFADETAGVIVENPKLAGHLSESGSGIKALLAYLEAHSDIKEKYFKNTKFIPYDKNNQHLHEQLKRLKYFRHDLISNMGVVKNFLDFIVTKKNVARDEIYKDNLEGAASQVLENYEGIIEALPELNSPEWIALKPYYLKFANRSVDLDYSGFVDAYENFETWRKAMVASAHSEVQIIK